MRVNAQFGYDDIIALNIEGIGWVGVTPGTVTPLADSAVAFIAEDGNQINVDGERVIATAVKPINEASAA
ncbi:hypothetical protein [Nonomuraea sp. NPDC052265]|uniref:hypothetical protein n=1 Tax=Nonomuraea sp. NPDC052265 TaxID=3364374 RepID=UPI0037CB5D3E